MMWLPFSLYISATPLMARLSLSVAPEVKMISFAVADQLRDALTCLLHRLLGDPAKLMVAAGGVAELLCEVRKHLFQHPRIGARGGMVVHVDGQLHFLVSIARNYIRAHCV